jgi:hypothetical protein
LYLSFSDKDSGPSRSSGETVTLAIEKHQAIANYKDGEFDEVATKMDLPMSPPFMAHVLRVLKPGGTFSAQIPKALNIESNLLNAGFTDVSSTSNDSSTHVTGKRSLAPIKTRNDEAKSDFKNSAVSAWSIAASDMTDEGIELADEDALLERETFKVDVPRAVAASDCGTSTKGKKKACKNCSCGLADQLKSTSKNASTPTVSSCGSCGLGDAFRCSTCPYMGMPAFKPGDVVKLDI